MFSNLIYAGKVSNSIMKQMKLANPAGFWSNRLIQNRQNIVTFAIRKHGNEELLQKVQSKRRSDTSPEKLIDDFLKFEQPAHPVIRDEHYLTALRVTKRLYQPDKKLRPAHFPDQRYYPWNLPPSAEAPWSYQSHIGELLRQKQIDGEITDNRRSFHNLYNEIFETNRLLIHLIKDGDSKFWDQNGNPIPYEFVNLHSRSHVVDEGEPDKIRAVFGVTKLLLQAEQHFIWPLQEQYLNGHKKSPLLWGSEMIKGGWRKLYNQAYKHAPFNTVISADWSQFDKRALHEVVDDVHDIWRSYFTFDNGYIPTCFYPDSKVNPERLERLWKWTCHSIKHTPICLPDGTKYVWKHNGIASGFQQTQLLDSFVNTIMILTVLSRAGINIESENFFLKIQGDDSLTCFAEQMFNLEGEHFLRRLAAYALEYFNAELSVKKSQITGDLNNVKVLGYSNIMSMPYRTDEDLLSHLLYPERSHGLPELATTCIGIAWASLGCSRIVYSVCKDIYSFLTEKLGVTPNPTSMMWLLKMGQEEANDYDLSTFPTFDEIWSSTFSTNIREQRAKERLYPTLPQSAGGFIFLPY